MDWIKIKAEHDSPEYTDAQFGALVRWQLKVAKYGRTPTEKELSPIRKSNLIGAELVLNSFGIGLELIQDKIIIDREMIRNRMDIQKEKKRKQRAVAICPPGQGSGRTETEKNKNKNKNKNKSKSKNKEIIRKEIIRKEIFKKPTIEEIKKHVEEKKYHFNPETFFFFYESKGWKVGKNQMKSWTACCITWEQKYKAEHPQEDNSPEYWEKIRKAARF